MQAMILAGGLGTRIQPLLNGLNKPMLPVASKPFLEYLLRQLQTCGIVDIVLCVGYRGQIIEDYFGSGDKWGVNITYSYEPTPLGTAGAVRFAASRIRGDCFLVLNGDSYLDADLSSLMTQHHQTGALATMALAWREDTRRYGTVEINDDGQIRSFHEKTDTSQGGFINCGVYLFHREILSFIPAHQAVSLERDVFPAIIGRRFYGCRLDGYFVDIGVPEAYLNVLANPLGLSAHMSTDCEMS